jgi:hypothetical protein
MVTHYVPVRKAGGPAASSHWHGTADPALHRPAVKYSLADEGLPHQALRRSREPESGGCHEGRLGRGRRGGPGRRRLRHRSGPAGRAAAWGHGIVLGHLLLAVLQLLRQQPLVVRLSVTLPPHQVAHDTAYQQAVEQQLHLVLAILSPVGNRPGSLRRPCPLEEGLEAVDIDRRAAAHPARQGERVGVGARRGGNGEGAVLARAQLANVRGVKQLLGP